MVLGAEVENRGGEEAKLHAGLNLQGGVQVHQFVEAGKVAAGGAAAAHAFGEAARRNAGLGHELQLAEHAGAVLVTRQPRNPEHVRVLRERTGGPALFRPLAVEDVGEAGDVDASVCLGFVT